MLTSKCNYLNQTLVHSIQKSENIPHGFLAKNVGDRQFYEKNFKRRENISLSRSTKKKLNFKVMITTNARAVDATF